MMDSYLNNSLEGPGESPVGRFSFVWFCFCCECSQPTKWTSTKI